MEVQPVLSDQCTFAITAFGKQRVFRVHVRGNNVDSTWELEEISGRSQGSKWTRLEDHETRD